MNKQEIKEAISGISQLLENNPELLLQQLSTLKSFFPDLDESAIKNIIEKTKQADFKPSQLVEEIEGIIGPTKSASQNIRE